MPPIEPPDPPSDLPPEGVPRRFGLGSLLACVAVFSGISAILPWQVAMILIASMVGVGFAQSRAGPGTPARQVSCLVGGSIGMLSTLIGFVMSPSLHVLINGMLFSVLAGMLTYFAGTLIAGVFLLGWMVESSRKIVRNATLPPRPIPALPPSPPVSWTVWRQDDLGNRFAVATVPTQEEARELQHRHEAVGHKQIYWVEPEEPRPVP